ncbi:hypothetical protein [Halorussus lipolyticus]|uniref:hypothetical protein n=1 Tax=Halorussus lipolyticus TaxID=3034024 RepID=UPI0023E8C0A5|nr:hypothetical protein [Halorussus sp. DT80]
MRSLSSSDADSDDSRPTPDSPTPRRRRIEEGAKGGLVATLVLTAYRLPVSHALPPTAEFWSQFVAGGDPDDHALPALVLHLVYGLSLGTLLGSRTSDE